MMTLSDLSDIGSLVGGVAILASLIFVGLQLRQNTEAVRAAASQAYYANWQATMTPIIEHEDLARLYRRGLGDLASLSDDERVRFIVLVTSLFRFAESAHLQWLRGLLEKSLWFSVEHAMTEIGRQPGCKSYWALRRQWYAPEFQAWYEALPAHEASPLFDAKGPA